MFLSKAGQSGTVAYRRKTCPECGGRKIARIMYGYMPIDEKLQEKLDSGKIVLGGCCVGPDDPGWECGECGHGWGRRRD